jgi:hypothetical protein
MNSIFASLSIQNTQHQPTLTLLCEQCNVLIHIYTAHCFMWWRHTKWKTFSRTMEQDQFWWGSVTQRGNTWRRALLMQSHSEMNVWYILCKIKEAFIGKKSVSNHRLLLRVTENYLRLCCSSFKQPLKWGGGDLTALNLSTIISYHCCVILLHQTSEFQVIILITLCNFIKQLYNYT